VADTAGITKAMLSAYETGKQKPSLDTLEKILAALECDLNDLHNALQIVNERPEAIRRGREGAWPGPRREGEGSREGGEGGSSNVFKKALKDSFVNICTSSMMYTLYFPFVGAYLTDSRNVLISSIPRFAAPSISIMSND